MSDNETGVSKQFSPIARAVDENLANAIQAAGTGDAPTVAEGHVSVAEKPAIPEAITQLRATEPEFINDAERQLQELCAEIEQAGFSENQLDEIAPDVTRVKKALGLEDGGYARTEAEQKVAITKHLQTLARVMDFHKNALRAEGPPAPAAA